MSWARGAGSPGTPGLGGLSECAGTAFKSLDRPASPMQACSKLYRVTRPQQPAPSPSNLCMHPNEGFHAKLEQEQCEAWKEGGATVQAPGPTPSVGGVSRSPHPVSRVLELDTAVVPVPVY